MPSIFVFLLSIVFSLPTYSGIKSFADITNKVRPSKRNRPGTRYPLAIGRETYLNDGFAPRIKIIGVNQDETMVKVRVLDGDSAGDILEVDVRDIAENKGCAHDYCIGDDIAIYGSMNAIKAKLLGFVKEKSPRARGFFVIQYNDRRFMNSYLKRIAESSTFHTYRTVGCGAKGLCVGDRVYTYLRMGGKRQIRLSVIKGVSLTGRYMIYIHGRPAEERAFDFMYGSFFLAEDKTCGKAFCYNDVVTHKDYPRQRAVIKGIGYNGKYLIIFGEGQNTSKFLRNATDADLKKF